MLKFNSLISCIKSIALKAFKRRTIKSPVFFDMKSWDRCANNKLCLEQFSNVDSVIGIASSGGRVSSAVRLIRRDFYGEKHWYCIGPMFLEMGESIDILDADLTLPISSIVTDLRVSPCLRESLIESGFSVNAKLCNFKNYSEPMKELEAAINEGRFHHDGHPILRRHISNVVGRFLVGDEDQVMPCKRDEKSNINGAVAILLAMQESMKAAS